jgi:2-methylisocitrate lyase-like PEP mutase family enzyme
MHEGSIHPSIANGEVLVAAGVYDVLSAKLAARAGFQSVVLSGYAVSASYLGEPDFGLLTQNEMLDVARRVCRAVDIPVIVDGDTGHGSAINVQYLVRELLRMGAAGVILEDQTWPKRCGHMRGKSVCSLQDHVAKIRAAVDARREADRPFFITARTDALEPLGIDEAIRRGVAYKEAGADVIFVEAPQDEEQMRRIVAEIPGAKTINNIEGGATPILPLEELVAMGFFSVGFVLTGLYAAAHALSATYAHLLRHGTSAGLQDRMMGFDEFGEVIGLERTYALDEHYRAS